MNKTQAKTMKRNRRHARVRARVIGTANKPRLAVFRSNTAIYAQVIDDAAQKTLAATDSRKASGKNAAERAAAAGEKIAELAKKAGVETVVFDRGGFQYLGQIAVLADGARKGGLQF